MNCYNPDNAQYMDYYERVLYNHIVGSLHPTCYMTTYHYAVGLMHQNNGEMKRRSPLVVVVLVPKIM